MDYNEYFLINVRESLVRQLETINSITNSLGNSLQPLIDFQQELPTIIENMTKVIEYIAEKTQAMLDRVREMLLIYQETLLRINFILVSCIPVNHSQLNVKDTSPRSPPKDIVSKEKINMYIIMYLPYFINFLVYVVNLGRDFIFLEFLIYILKFFSLL